MRIGYCSVSIFTTKQYVIIRFPGWLGLFELGAAPCSLFCIIITITLTRGGLAVVLELVTGLSLVAFRTSTVEVLGHTVTLGLVLTRVWITGI